uniref:Enhancer of polycomb homolog 1 n=1 Tax=Gallus gallus TaxID=9031 RepID=A0A8V0XMX3_CHICK
MSKLSFRARALDASKPLPVFRCEDLPDLAEYASINRAVPQMPTGMEKEEESHSTEFSPGLWSGVGNGGEQRSAEVVVDVMGAMPCCVLLPEFCATQDFGKLEVVCSM